MKPTTYLRSASLLFAVSLPILMCAAMAQAGEADQGKVTVTGLLGLAQFSHAGGPYAAVKVGTVVQAGDQIQTANDSALDLSFGKSVGVVRMLQSTTLSITTLTPTAVELHLKGGELVGQWKKQPAGSKFQIEVSNGIAGILEGEFRLDSRGYLVLLEGTAVFVEAQGEAEPVAKTLKAEKPVYYSPGEHTIRAAPKQLQREVSKQMKAKLPKR